MRIQKWFILGLVLTLSACITVRKNATFVIKGKVTDSYGQTLVLTPSNNVDLCVKVNFTTDVGTAESTIECSDLITKQDGSYFLKRSLELSAYNGDKIEIQSAKIYGKFSQGQQTFYFPVNVKSIDLSDIGGIIEADIAVFSLD